jgi:hypothetical protein
MPVRKPGLLQVAGSEEHIGLIVLMRAEPRRTPPHQERAASADHGPCNSSRRQRHPSLEHRRPLLNNTPRNVTSGSDSRDARRRRRTCSRPTLNALNSEPVISLYVIR